MSRHATGYTHPYFDPIEPTPQLEVKGILDYHCSTCKRFITPAEGGIRCRNCNHLFCCDHKCIPAKHCKDATYPGGVNTCPKCNGFIIPTEVKPTIIQVHTVDKAQTPLEHVLSKHLGRNIVSPPPRHGMDTPEKPKKMDKRLIGYYDL